MAEMMWYRHDALKRTLKLALPMIGALMAQRVLQLIATFMMGYLGADALAAGAVASATYATFVVIGVGLVNGVGVLMAHSYGARQDSLVRHNLYQGFYLCVLFSILGMLFAWYIPTFLFWIGEPPEIIALSRQFLHAVLWGFPALLLFFALREFVTVFSHPRIVMQVSLLAIPFNIVMSYVLMLGKLGLPALHMAGIGYANALTEWFMCLSVWIYIQFIPRLRTVTVWFPWIPIDFRAILRMLRLGLPTGIAYFFEMGMFSVITLLMARFGIPSLAAHQVAFMCCSLAYMFPLGISLVVGVQISERLGARQFKQVLPLIYSGFGLALLFSVFMAILFLTIPQIFLLPFLHSETANYEATRQVAISLFAIMGVFHVFDAMQSVASACLRGFKETVFPMLISIGAYSVIAPSVGYGLAVLAGLQAVGLWWGLAVGFMVSSVILLIRLCKVYSNFCS